jgi:FlaA1/EpsC-like NDP-sugar epimerase
VKDKILKLFSWYFNKRVLPYWLVLVIDSIIVVVSGMLAMLLQHDSYVSINNFFTIAGTFACYLVAYLIGFRIMKTYLGVIRYSSFVDLYRVALANLIGIAIIFIIRHITPIDKVLFPVSWEVLLISFVLSTTLMWGMRIIVKYIYDIYFVSSSARKVFIYGVKEGGIALAKSIHSQESHFVSSGLRKR